MKTLHLLAAASALTLSLGAQAAESWSLLSSAPGSFLTLSASGIAGVATLSGGSVLTSSVPGTAAMPAATVGAYLSAGASGPATLDFTNGGVDAVSFLWGSPDTYNVLTVGRSGGVATQYGVTALDFTTFNGDQTFSQYVSFSAGAGSRITSLTFGNTASSNAFEVSNFEVTTPVPEPEVYALMLAGLGAIGFVARRQKAR